MWKKLSAFWSVNLLLQAVQTKALLKQWNEIISRDMWTWQSLGHFCGRYVGGEPFGYGFSSDLYGAIWKMLNFTSFLFRFVRELELEAQMQAFSPRKETSINIWIGYVASTVWEYTAGCMMILSCSAGLHQAVFRGCFPHCTCTDGDPGTNLDIFLEMAPEPEELNHHISLSPLGSPPGDRKITALMLIRPHQPHRSQLSSGVRSSPGSSWLHGSVSCMARRGWGEEDSEGSAGPPSIS